MSPKPMPNHGNSGSGICRICLADGVRSFTITGSLQLVYEKLMSGLLHIPGRPKEAYYICHTLLKKCYKLMLTASRADHILTTILANSRKVTKKSVTLKTRQVNGLCATLVYSGTECTDTPPPVEPKPEVDVKNRVKIEDAKTEDSLQPHYSVGDVDYKNSDSEDDEELEKQEEEEVWAGMLIDKQKTSAVSAAIQK